MQLKQDFTFIFPIKIPHFICNKVKLQFYHLQNRTALTPITSLFYCSKLEHLFTT